MEEQLEQGLSTKQPHLEQSLILEGHLKGHLEQHHLTLQDWWNRGIQSYASEYQSHTNEVRLEPSPETKENDLSGNNGQQAKSFMNQKA